MAVRVLWRDSEPSAYVAGNLSASGALLRGNPALVPGAEIRVALPIGGLTFHARARVIRAETDEMGNSGSAVRFLDLHPNVQDRIQSYVLALLKRSAGRRASTASALDADAHGGSSRRSTRSEGE